MDSVSLDDYKDALMQAAWVAGVKYVSTDSWGASGLAEQPAVILGIPYYKDCEERSTLFSEEFDKEVGECYLINVLTAPVMKTVGFSHRLIYDGKWVGNVR